MAFPTAQEYHLQIGIYSRRGMACGVWDEGYRLIGWVSMHGLLIWWGLDERTQFPLTYHTTLWYLSVSVPLSCDSGCDRVICIRGLVIIMIIKWVWFLGGGIEQYRWRSSSRSRLKDGQPPRLICNSTVRLLSSLSSSNTTYFAILYYYSLTAWFIYCEKARGLYHSHRILQQRHPVWLVAVP